jgi:hypothetical protein
VERTIYPNRRRLAAKLKRLKLTDRYHERIAAGTNRRRNAKRHFRAQREPPTRKFSSCVLPKHLRKPRMGAPTDQGPHRVVKRTARGGEHFLNNPVPPAFVTFRRFRQGGVS